MSSDALFPRFPELSTKEIELLKQLYAHPDLSKADGSRIADIIRAAEPGVEAVLSRKRSRNSLAGFWESVSHLKSHGIAGLISVGPQRGGDFLQNQLRGRWAEDVIAGYRGAFVFVPFGPSGAAMPGDEDHNAVVSTLRLVQLLEGKRPDLLMFSRRAWLALSASERTAAESWPTRLLKTTDGPTIQQAEAGVEVKNSTWHYGRRRTAGGTPLSVTIKDEEIQTFKAWIDRNGRPILFFQVMFDEIYCMNFARMLDSIDRGLVRGPGDYKLERRGAGSKVYHKFFVDGPPHLCGHARFPSDSAAEIRILPSGSVIPYIRYAPAEVLDFDDDAVREELAYSASI